jgi:hypothetical protein
MQCSTPELTALSLFSVALNYATVFWAFSRFLKVSGGRTLLTAELSPEGFAAAGFVQLGQMLLVGSLLLGIGLDDWQNKA